MVVSAKGTFYQPAPPPQSGGEAELRRWSLQQFQLIALAMRSGRAEFLTLDVLQRAPAKPFQGMLAYFAATIVGPTEGLYEYRSDAAWHKL